jgi:hypothetical protein
MKLLTSIFAQAPEKPEDWAKLKADEKTKIIAAISKDLSELFKEIASEFSREFGKRVTVTSDELLDVVTHILPADYPKLKTQMTTIMNEAPTSGEAGFAFMSLYSSLINKEKIAKNESPTASGLKTQLLSDESSASAEERKQLSKKIKVLEAAQKVGAKLLQTTTEAKIARLQVDLLVLDNFITEAPSYIKKYPIGDQSLMDVLNELHKAYKIVIDNFHADVDEAAYDQHARNILDFQRVHTKLMLGLFKTLDDRIDAAAKLITPSAHKELKSQIDALNSYLPILMLSYDTRRVYMELVSKFTSELGLLVEKIGALPEAHEQVMHRLKSMLSDKEAAKQLPAHEYPFVISAADLRKSTNAFMQDQIQLTQRYTELPENADKFILSGKLKDNLFQIEKDAGRNLLIQGKEVKELKGEALRQHLEATFGAENALNLIKHYDQGLSLMISGGPSGGTSTANLMDQAVLLKQSDRFTQNLFLVDGVVYRDATLKHLDLFVRDDEDNPNWKLKVNLKALSWATKDGFTLQYMGTDSPLICAALMEKSNYENLSNMIKIVQSYEKIFRAINEEAPASKKHNQLLKTEAILATIDDFKQGKITFDELAGSAKAFADQATEIINSRSKLTSFVAAIKKDENDPLPKMIGFSKELSTLKEAMDKKVAPHQSVIVEKAASSQYGM